MLPRMLVHFSCGAASAVAWKLCVNRFSTEYEVEAVYCNLLKNEHEDNLRFMHDVEKWIGAKVKLLSHPKYDDIDDLFIDQQFMTTPYGAICTKTMKRQVRERYQRRGDTHIFGLTVDESERIKAFNKHNPNLNLLWVLSMAGVTKTQCYNIISAAGIELPMMYRLGYGHNNCIGCVKGGKGYWNKIRRDFPDVFARRATIQREVGCAFGSSGNNFFLDELDLDAGRDEPPQDIECGPVCMGGMIEKDASRKLISLSLTSTPPPVKVVR